MDIQTLSLDAQIQVKRAPRSDTFVDPMDIHSLAPTLTHVNVLFRQQLGRYVYPTGTHSLVPIVAHVNAHFAQQ
jgi:hypothetical protein